MILLNQNIARQLTTAAEAFSDECCGFLFGHELANRRMVTCIMEVDNASPADKNRSFQITSRDYMRAENFAEKNQLNLLGVYHSHPNGSAIPSEYDRVAAQPFFSYIILSVMNKKVEGLRSWNLNSNFQFEEEALYLTYINYPLNGYRNYPNTAA